MIFMFRIRVVLPLSRFLAFSFFTFFLTSAGRCQINNVGDDTSTPIEGAGHDYLKMLSETVNPAAVSPEMSPRELIDIESQHTP
jgi:hypothetical protein